MCLLILSMIVFLIAMVSVFFGGGGEARKCEEGQLTYKKSILIVGKSPVVTRDLYDNEGSCEL